MRMQWICNLLLKLATLYLIGSIVVSWRAELREEKQIYTETQIPLNTSPQLTDGRYPITKLLFLGYCRGGSSISSEIFDTDDRAIFWYEPLDAFYFSETGYYGRKEQKVLMNNNESDFRSVEPWEHSGIADLFRSLYSCNLTGVTTEFLAHRFMKHNSALDGYYRCYQRLSPDAITQDLDNCRDELQNVCGKTVDKALQNGCDKVMGVLHANTKKIMKDAEIRTALLASGLESSRVSSILQKVISYRKCMNTLETIVEKCRSDAEKSCSAKRLRTAKVLRITMPLIKSIMTTVPDLLVTIFIRDPRAMAYSRAGNNKLEYNILNNIKLVCKKLKLDFLVKRELDAKYPGSVLVLRYEDFVQDPHHWAGVMYRHVGYGTPVGLNDFIDSHMFSGQDDAKKWGNIRPNATDIAYRWLQEVSPDLMSKMQDICGDVITMLHYPLY